MKLEQILSKYQNYFLGIAILCASIAASIRFGDGETNLLLQNYPVAIFLMVTISLILVACYIQIDKRRIATLSNKIKDQSSRTSEDFGSLVAELTDRQKEVYNLILAGKTNKEIVAELFIEQSTLKSHINQIYKKLNIKSRRELKTKASP